MKVCIIGSTGHTAYVLKGLKELPEVELAGIAPGSSAEDVEPLLRSAEAYGWMPAQFASYTDMLDQLKPDIAAVACGFHDHAAVAMQAMRRGIHVFVEKPLALTLEDLEQVKAIHRQSGVHLAAMFGMRYMSCFLTAKQLIGEGVIGDVRLMTAQKSYRLGERSELYRSRATYGGTIPWVGSHAIDWLYWLSGESFHSVYASHSCRANNGHRELEASALCHFTFSNEVFGSVSIDYLRPRQAPSHSDDRIRIAGSEGVLEVREQKVLLMRNGLEGVHEMPLLAEGQSFVDFVRQVRGEAACLVSAADSFAVTEAALKARQSADEGRIVYF
ncbi:Gfo/Idh/MocA family oxidoreductase [Paenibacillus oryzisoli]|uniref:Gfo/Idh/MocA family protein n=1 Tax=Paenibacillus oryzisoli TaxID=1850517 RepID=UPI003D2E161C